MNNKTNIIVIIIACIVILLFTAGLGNQIYHRTIKREATELSAQNNHKIVKVIYIYQK